MGAEDMTAGALDCSPSLDPVGASPMETDPTDPDTISLVNLVERHGISLANPRPIWS